MQAWLERLELLVEQLQAEVRVLRAHIGVGAEDFELIEGLPSTTTLHPSQALWPHVPYWATLSSTRRHQLPCRPPASEQ